LNRLEEKSILKKKAKLRNSVWYELSEENEFYADLIFKCGLQALEVYKVLLKSHKTKKELGVKDEILLKLLENGYINRTDKTGPHKPYIWFHPKHEKQVLKKKKETGSKFVKRRSKPKVKLKLHKNPIEKLEPVKIVEEKPIPPPGPVVIKKELWIKLGPEGKTWIDSGIGYGSGTTSKDLLLALQKTGPIKVGDLISLDGIYIREDEDGLNLLNTLNSRKVVELYEKEVK